MAMSSVEEVGALIDVPIFFIYGGPGAGKGTQCAKLVKGYGLSHLSNGDLLRAEVATGSTLGVQIQEFMSAGDVVPLHIVLALIRQAMINILHTQGTKGFLIDGCWELEQGKQFEDTIGIPTLLLAFHLPDCTLTHRLRNRAKSSGRVDDNEETIQRRLATFHRVSKPVLDHYGAEGKLVMVDGSGSVEEVFAQITLSIEHHLL